VNLNEAFKALTQQLQNAEIEGAYNKALILLSEITGLSKEQIIAGRQFTLSAEHQDNLREYTTRALMGEPVSKIIGKREFWGMPFITNANVLDPRPDSETIIETVLELITEKDARFDVLDLGTGSGCLLISILREFPNARGVGVDISAPALEVAIQNARNLEVYGRASFTLSDWTKNLENRKFSLVISNPPYVSCDYKLDNTALRYDPSVALYSGVEGLDSFRAIAKQIKHFITESGLILFEIGIGQLEAVKQIFSSAGLVFEGSRSDLAGIPRVVIFRNKFNI
jgi:release factor glutamine methyltransferase